MLRRNRTTKALARRIDLEYFSRPHWFRRWRLWLSIGVPAIVLAWFFVQHAQGGQRAYSSGPLSHSHAAFTKQCGVCHVQQAGAFFREVKDEACLRCHDGPVHHENQKFTPACTSCHVEHKGASRLSATSDTNCTQCHSELRTKSGGPKYDAAIAGFDLKHPDVRAERDGANDPGHIKLNHYVHMQPGLIGPNQTRVQMTCDDCHRSPGINEVSPYAGSAVQVEYAALHPGDPAARPLTAMSGRSYMSSPEFAKHCAGCHLLSFDGRFGDEPVPHDQPKVVRAFLEQRFAAYIAVHPASVHEVEKFDRELPERPNALKIARNANEWVRFRVEDAEWLLYRKTCKQCHVLKAEGDGSPQVEKAQITQRWLQHAEFDHYPHRAVTCGSCHVKAINSRETSDVLIADIASCRNCHKEGGTAHEAAEGRCFECHQYHDWSKAKRTKGTYTIEELRGVSQLTTR
jgi:hypothetical protein